MGNSQRAFPVALECDRYDSLISTSKYILSTCAMMGNTSHVIYHRGMEVQGV